MNRTRVVRWWIGGWVGLLLLAACGAGGSPAIEATRSWLKALTDFNFKQVMELTCSNPQARNQIEVRLDPLIDMQETLQALKGQFDFSGLKFEELSNNGRVATVRLSGKMFLKALGQKQALDVYEEVTLVKESDQWRMCNNAASLLKF